MKIGGFVKTSFVDYPGKIASVVFTQGCNLRCGYCHNVSLLDTQNASKVILPEEVFAWLSKRKGMINAVVISGGEPTLQEDLYVFIVKLKAMNLFVKLDTNGTNPDILRALIDDELLDFIAMDLKAPLCKYGSLTGTSLLELQAIRASVEVIKNCGLAYEFRTTYCSELDADDIPNIILDFEITSNYILQNCRGVEQRKVSRNRQDFERLTQCSKKDWSLLFRGFQEVK